MNPSKTWNAKLEAGIFFGLCRQFAMGYDLWSMIVCFFILRENMPGFVIASRWNIQNHGQRDNLIISIKTRIVSTFGLVKILNGMIMIVLWPKEWMEKSLGLFANVFEKCQIKARLLFILV